MIALTEGQLIFLDLVATFILLGIGASILDNRAENKTFTIPQRVLVTVLTILSVVQISNHFIADLRLNKPTVTTTTKIIYNGKNADDSTITQVKHSDSNYYDIKRNHYAPTDIRLATALKQPITYYNQLILTVPSKKTAYDQDYDIQKATVNENGTIVSKLTLTTHKHIYKNPWSIFALVDKTYELTATV